MKKMYKYILIIILMMFGFMGEVRANIINQVCSYTVEQNSKIKKIDLFYNTLDNEYNIKINNGGFKTLSTGKNGDYFISPNAEKQLEKAECPVNIYNDNNFLCFDTNEDSAYCTTEDFKSNFWKADRNFLISNKISSDNYEVSKVFRTNIIDKTGLNISPKAPFNACIDDSLGGEIGESDYDYCEALCYYSDKELKNFAFIYFVKNATLDDEKFKVSFSWSTGANGQGEMRVLYDDKNPITYAAMSLEAKTDLIIGINGKKQCPFKVYRNDYETAGEGKICFENKERYCTNKKVDILVNEDLDDFDVEENEESIDKVEEELETDVSNCEDVKKDITTNFTFSNEIDEFCAFENEYNKDNIYYIITSDKKFRFFRYSNKKIDEITAYSDNNIVYNKFKTCSVISSIRCKDNECFEKDDKNAGSLHYNYKQTCRLIINDKDFNSNIKDVDCVSILGRDLIEEINSYFLYLKIAIPIIIIVMGSIDFGKAFIASDEDKMKKAQKQFIMRLIVGLVIFFIPSLLNVLLNIANQVWGIFKNTCGITF